MKKMVLLVVIFLSIFIGNAVADDCYSSGLKTSELYIEAKCLCGVELIPAAADSTLIVYDTAKVLFKTAALASTIPSGFPPGTACIPVYGGIIRAVPTGASAGYILWTR